MVCDDRIEKAREKDPLAGAVSSLPKSPLEELAPSETRSSTIELDRQRKAVFNELVGRTR